MLFSLEIFFRVCKSRVYNQSSLIWALRFEFMTDFEFVPVELEIATRKKTVKIKMSISFETDAIIIVNTNVCKLMMQKQQNR